MTLSYLVTVLSLALTALSGCRRSEGISFNGQNVKSVLTKLGNPGPIAVGVPIQVPNALQAARTWFQTRGVISLTITGDQFAPGTNLQLFDDTTGSSLISGASGALGLDELSTDKGLHAELLDGGYSFILELYPLDPNIAGKVAYGANNLRIVADSTKPIQSSQQVYLHDFSYFAMGTSAFADPVQRQDGWQGQVDYLSQAATVDGSAQLTMGPITLFNW